ncbi:Protease prsW family protein [Actinopolymorpha cephalotaxi]|uniref:Protease prsW family protein n=1 Tax=Actinopolymorpha cephalotaxi TaxID=504797 RepID=A0A1I2YX26_9ACTN|nr:PrsW family glutamic-type intramembrane protease [Actinopolymorpha cephalotaxi]NYH81736.1 RsiW-degrading membrane proteinase PrsW (M82 family) [Actinopolymorpha cephalotaxi]SFH29965.1 Protease prsW family protein [Actinopolymorpha cephalotaxi]
MSDVTGQAPRQAGPDEPSGTDEPAGTTDTTAPTATAPTAPSATAPTAPTAPTAMPALPGRPPGQRRGLMSYAWGRFLLAGLALWLVAALVTLSGGDTPMLPVVVLLGAFLGPLAYARWVHERRPVPDLDLSLLVRAYLVSGVLGLLCASLLAGYFRAPSTFAYVGVALGEEIVKALVLLYLARALPTRTMRSGLVLGAVVGFGFGACETAGYGLQALLNVSGLSLRTVVETELLRGPIGPVGQALWTALLGGTIFAATRGGRLRPTTGILFTLLGVGLLHALWDSLRSVAIVFTLLITGTAWEPRLLSLGVIPRPTAIQIQLYAVTCAVGFVLLVALGVLWLGILRRRPAGPAPVTVTPDQALRAGGPSTPTTTQAPVPPSPEERTPDRTDA